eukprot:1184894-Prorocentrum_minimum.AAC.4
MAPQVRWRRRRPRARFGSGPDSRARHPRHGLDLPTSLPAAGISRGRGERIHSQWAPIAEGER